MLTPSIATHGVYTIGPEYPRLYEPFALLMSNLSAFVKYSSRLNPPPPSAHSSYLHHDIPQRQHECSRYARNICQHPLPVSTLISLERNKFRFHRDVPQR